MNARGRRYDMSTVRQAQNLNAGGWSHREIHRILLSEDGPTPTPDTLARWLSPAYAESTRRRMLRANAKLRAGKGFAFRLGGHPTKSYKEAFVLRLVEERVPRTSIAKVCTVVFGEPWTRDRVCAALGEKA